MSVHRDWTISSSLNRWEVDTYQGTTLVRKVVAPLTKRALRIFMDENIKDEDEGLSTTARQNEKESFKALIPELVEKVNASSLSEKSKEGLINLLIEDGKECSK